MSDNNNNNNSQRLAGQKRLRENNNNYENNTNAYSHAPNPYAVPKRPAIKRPRLEKKRITHNTNRPRQRVYYVNKNMTHKRSNTIMKFKRYIRPCLEQKDEYGDRILTPGEVEMIKKIYRRAHTVARAPKRPIYQPNVTKKKANNAHIVGILAHYLKNVGSPTRNIGRGRREIFAVPPEFANLSDEKKIQIFEAILGQIGYSFENTEPGEITIGRVKEIYNQFQMYLPDYYKERISTFIRTYKQTEPATVESPPPDL
jgi:hypothetical protein